MLNGAGEINTVLERESLREILVGPVRLFPSRVQVSSTRTSLRCSYECKLKYQPEFQQKAIRKGARVKEHCNTDLEGKERAQVGV